MYEKETILKMDEGSKEEWWRGEFN
jgi:hypothetical protein